MVPFFLLKTFCWNGTAFGPTSPSLKAKGIVPVAITLLLGGLLEKDCQAGEDRPELCDSRAVSTSNFSFPNGTWIGASHVETEVMD